MGVHVPRCTFCGKSHQEVQVLFRGPDQSYICNECVGTCVTMLGDEECYVQEALGHLLAQAPDLESMTITDFLKTYPNLESPEGLSTVGDLIRAFASEAIRRVARARREAEERARLEKEKHAKQDTELRQRAEELRVMREKEEARTAEFQRLQVLANAHQLRWVPSLSDFPVTKVPRTLSREFCVVWEVAPLTYRTSGGSRRSIELAVSDVRLPALEAVRNALGRTRTTFVLAPSEAI